MGIETIIAMIPKGGKYAKSVVNFVHKVPQNWEKFKSAIQQITDILKQGKLRLDGKQKTIFESNKNILKNHEKVTKKAVKVLPSVKKEFPAFNTSKEDFTKGWKPTLYERSNLRNVYKELDPPASKYTKEMEAIDEELDALAFGGSKYEHLSVAEKNKLMKKLQAEMKKLIDATKKETKPGDVKKNVEEVFFDHPNDPRLYKSKPKDLTTLSLSQINKKRQNLQKRIREIADNPDIKGTVYEGPKKDMIAAIYDSENAALSNARKALTKKNSELKYGKKYPVLDPENDMFIVLGLDERGSPIRMGRTIGKFSATKDSKTGDLSRAEGTSFYDRWNAETNQIRKEGEEVFTNTLNREGKEIMSNPDYKIPKTPNMDIQTEFYTDLSTSDLAKKGYTLKQVDMIVKGRKVREYLEKTQSPDVNISMHEQTSTNDIGPVLEDLYNRGEDVYKMSMKEWVTKIPEYFAEGGRTGFRNPGLVTKGIEIGAKLKNVLAEGGIFAALIAAMEAGTIGLDEALKMLGKQESNVYKPSDFYRLWKNYQSNKEFLKRNKARKTRGGPEMQEDYYSGYYKEHMPELTWRAIHPEDKEKISSSKEMRDYVYPPEEPKEEIDWDILESFKNDPTWLKIKKWLEERKGHATGGVSNLFRKRQGYRGGKAVELVTKLPEFLKFVERLLIKASNEIRQGVGKWKGLDQKQRIVQHDNLTKLATEFQKTKKFDVKINEYTGIDAEKAFIEAQAEVKAKEPLGQIWKSSEGETQGMAMGFNKEELKALDYAMKKGMALSDAMTKMGFDVASTKDTLKFDKLVSEGMIGFSKEMKEQIIRAKYGDVVNQKLLDQMLTDTNPQRLAEVMGTIDEGVIMHDKGMGTDEIITTLKESFKRRPNVEGGLIPGYATGGVSNLFRRR